MYFLNEAEILIEALKNYYKVETISQLAEALGVSQPTLSAWRKRNSIGSIRAKCQELDIYYDIFETEETLEKINRLKSSKNNFSQHGRSNTQIGEQHNQGDGIKHENKGNNSTGEGDLNPLFNALQAVAVAFNKEEFVKSEIKKLIATVSKK